MTLTSSIKLLPTNEQKTLLDSTMIEYISLINDILDYAIAIGFMPKLSSATVHAKLPAALRDQCRLDARHIWFRHVKNPSQKLPTLKKASAIWNNQNYVITENGIFLPFWKHGKTQRIFIKSVAPKSALDILKSKKLGTLRITKKSNKYIAQIAYETKPNDSTFSTVLMGVDVGLKCPAVCCTSDGKTKFFGNGRKNKYIRRRYRSKRKKMIKKKIHGGVGKIDNKEHRIMLDIDHKLSKNIVDFAFNNGVSVIKLENLSDIQKKCSTRTSRKNKLDICTWTYRRLLSFIEYKAILKGISVIFVDPKYTSQICPVCGRHNRSNGRNYVCECGFCGHRDVVGARNILVA